ncbi:MAG: histidine phosphatase family protein [Bacteroidota bacterium]
MNIYIFRHGETEYNRLGIVQGSGVDTSLNEKGKAQAQAFFEYYQEESFEVVLTSALKRTHETVAPFIDKGLAWEQFPEINEMSWGVHEGKERTEEMKQKYRLVIDEWAKGNFDAALEGGESINELAARCLIFKNNLLHRKEKQILVCAHGRLIRCLMCVLLDRPLAEMENFGHSNTGLYEVKKVDKLFELVRANDTRHLENRPTIIKTL